MKACRICLITDVKMFYIDNVLEYYISVLASDESYRHFPNYVCYECASLLLKFVKFRKKYILSQSILANMFKEHGEITEQDIKKINKSTFGLKSQLSHTKLPPTYFSELFNSSDIVYKEMPNDEIKPDMDIKTDIEDSDAEEAEPVIPEEEVEIDVDVKPVVGDEPCSLKVRVENVSIKLENEGISAVEEQSQDVALDCGVLGNEQKEGKPEPQLKLPKDVQKRKQKVNKKTGPRPRKAKEKKPKQSKNTRKALDHDIDLSKYVTIIKLSVEEQLEELHKRKQSSNYLNTPLQCDLCYRGFIHTHAYKHHLMKHDPSAGDLECPICKIRFKARCLLRDHAKRNHEMKYVCKSCPYISRRELQAKQHQRWHDGVTYKCQYCDEICTKWTSYLGHLRIKHPSDFICDVCGDSFVSKLGVAMHKKKMHKNVYEKDGHKNETESGPYCKECDVKFVSVEAWNRHMVISAKHKQTAHIENLCRVCGKTFTSSEELQDHHKEEHAAKPLKHYPYPKFRTSMNWPAKCEHCSEEISNARQYWAHYRQRHPNEMYPLQRHHEYVCDICGKRFPTNTVLVYHKRTHSEKQFKCGTCGKAFHNRANLQTHETQTHSDLRPFPCALCDKAFKSNGALSRHSRCHTGAKPYTCELCGKAFSRSTSRKLHVNTVHLKQPMPLRVRRRQGSDRTPLTAVTTADTDTDT